MISLEQQPNYWAAVFQALSESNATEPEGEALSEPAKQGLSESAPPPAPPPPSNGSSEDCETLEDSCFYIGGVYNPACAGLMVYYDCL